MNHQQFSLDLQALQDRAAAWGLAAVPVTTSPDVEAVGEELHVALEELQVVAEELRRQNIELELAREAGEAERRRYQELFHFAPHGYLVTDLDATIYEANRAAARLLHVPERFLVGKPLALFVAAEDRRAFRSELMRCLSETNRVDELRLRLQPRDGASFAAALTVAVVTDRHGMPCGLRWMVQEAPGRPHASSHNGDEAPQTLFEQAPCGMGRLSADGRWLAANRKVCDLLGYRREELLRLNVQDVTHSDDRGLVAERLHALKSAEAPSGSAQCRWLHKDGRTLPVRWRVSPLIDPSGARRGCVVVVEEAGEPAEAGLQSRVEELANADRRKDEFLAMLAHELRNPLAPLSLSLQVIRRGGAAGSETAHAVDVAGHQVEKLTRLINELLDVARIRQGKTDLRMGPVDLAAVAAAAVETVRPLLDERLHTLEAPPPAPVLVQGDACRLEQVLANLLTNAAKYTEPGGRISLRVERDGEQAVVRVRDNGVGLVADMLPRIFEPFMQSEQSLHRARGGLGLGLSLVKRFVELHGGTVEAHSEGAGRGSEFIVRLPALPAGPSPQAPVPAPETASTPQAMPVLIVDDNRDAANSMAQLARLWGCDATAAYDGPAAVAAARARPPAVVFLDLDLPGMDGYETARRLRETLKPMPLLIALTGFGGDEEQARTKQAGFDAHLLKPVDLRQVKEWIARAGRSGERPASP